MVELVDTHCHVQSIGDYEGDYVSKKWRDEGVATLTEVLKQSAEAGVTRVVAVGTNLQDSILAAQVAKSQKNCWASMGVHPHEAKENANSKDNLQQIRKLLEGEKVVAVGEIGLDYFYEHSDKPSQKFLLEELLQIAQDVRLPVILHVRNAYEDFWPIFDNFQIKSGVLHSFSATTKELDEGLSRGLHIGLNGIMTFTKDENQLEAARRVPLDHLLLETDAPYLTPKPFRGEVCVPGHTKIVAEFLASLRSEKLERLAEQTTKNAIQLFNLEEAK